MAASKLNGNYSLRALLTELGGIANVDSTLNKPGDARARGEDVLTGRALVDLRGRQEEPTKAGGPPEVLEMLFVRPDGSCEIVSAADSQTFYDRYRSTLDPPAVPPGGADVPAGVPPGLNTFEGSPSRQGTR
jgi:hypothetical protein